MLVLLALALALPWAAAALHPRPLVLWHGLGDSHASPGMLEFQQAIKQIHPGIFIHSVYIHDDLGADRNAAIVRPLFPLITPFLSAHSTTPTSSET